MASLLLFILFHIAREQFLPALILLAFPTATVTYVMAREMHGDADLAVATVSASTLLSSVTFMFWLKIRDDERHIQVKPQEISE